MSMQANTIIPGLFRDRRDAGRRLAAKLSAYANRPDVIVPALPRGGVLVGYEIARARRAARRVRSARRTDRALVLLHQDLNSTAVTVRESESGRCGPPQRIASGAAGIPFTVVTPGLPAYAGNDALRLPEIASAV